MTDGVVMLHMLIHSVAPVAMRLIAIEGHLSNLRKAGIPPDIGIEVCKCLLCVLCELFWPQFGMTGARMTHHTI